MNKDLAAILWYQYVLDNYDRLKAAVDTISTNDRLLTVRQYMAEMGHEITPGELQEFAVLLEGTLEKIEKNGDHKSTNRNPYDQ
jgi:hypothetical protein